MKDSFTQLLVHIDATRHCAARLAAARAIAATQGARVAALYAVTPAILDTPFAAEAGPEAAAILNEIDAGRRNGARDMVDQCAASEGPQVSWAHTGMAPSVATFAGQALYADLMVLGQHNSSDAQFSGVPADFVPSVLARSGKPALVVPYNAPPAPIGRTVVIAWKPSPESARAVTAAMPLLQKASRVRVLSWGTDDGGVQGARLSLAGFLQLRGIEATWHHEEGDEPGQLGEMLLSRCCDLGADLLVMGCYGHSRAREWALGGVTRTILRSMTLPVLMAH